MATAWIPKHGPGPALMLSGHDSDRTVSHVEPTAPYAHIASLGRVFVRDLSVPHSSRLWDMQLDGDEVERIGARDSYLAAKELERTWKSVAERRTVAA